MSNWIIINDVNHLSFESVQKELLNYGVLMRLSNSMIETIEMAKTKKYLMTVIISKNSKPDYLPYLEVLRDASAAPIYILSDNPKDHNSAIEGGADLFRILSGNMSENVKAGWSLIRRFTDLNYRPSIPVTVLTYEDIFMCIEYRTVFVKGIEIDLTRIEFEILRLLLSSPKRVFTYDQIYEFAWETEATFDIKRTIIAHTARLRKKIIQYSSQKNIILNKHGIGYCLVA